MNLGDPADTPEPTLDTVPGWLAPLDARMLAAIDALQARSGITGDIFEIGVYHGRSAIVLGGLVRGSERLTVCDLFTTEAPVESDNRAENQTYYQGLTREAFERQYLRFHDLLPEILAVPSTAIDAEARSACCRLVHVDGSHIYRVVQHDIETARTLLCPGGIIVLDDWSQHHTPGVAMAVWEKVINGGLIPLCLTEAKFYATWDVHHIVDVYEMLRGTDIFVVEEHLLGDHRVPRLAAASPGVGSWALRDVS